MSDKNIPNSNEENSEDPLKNIFSQFLNSNEPNNSESSNLDPNYLSQMFTQIGSLLNNPTGETVNWSVAEETAQKIITKNRETQETINPNISNILRLAELWVDKVTIFPTTNTITHTWDREQWLKETLPLWKTLAQPVAEVISSELAATISDNVPPEMRGMLDNTQSMLKSIGGGIFGSQFGQALGSLACEVLSTTDISIPIVENKMAIVPENIKKFTAGLEIPEDEAILFFAIRENVHTRLFTHVPWLKTQMISAITEYAKGIKINTDRIEELARNLDPTATNNLQEALNMGIFTPGKTPEQQKALDRLETLIALSESWVDKVTQIAAKDITTEVALSETMRRRRASGGPAEKTLNSLVGLEISPKNLRNAHSLWENLTNSISIEERDNLWEHPDLLPNLEDLNNHEQYRQKLENKEEKITEVDIALQEIFKDAAKNNSPKSTNIDPQD